MLVPTGAPPETIPEAGMGATSGPLIPQSRLVAASAIESGVEPSRKKGASIASLGGGRCGLIGLTVSSPQPERAKARAHIQRPLLAAIGCTNELMQPPRSKSIPNKL